MAKINIKYKKGGPSQISALRAALKEPIDLKESLESVITELNAFEQQYEVFDAAEADGANMPLVGFVDDPDKIYAGF